MLTIKSRILEIDGLRGIAILSVLIYHVLPFAPFSNGDEVGGVLGLLAYGVDLFFVISGFLIGAILQKIKSVSGIKTFYLRRALRIWPLYYLLLFLVYSSLSDKSMFSDAPYWSFPFFIFNFWESYGGKVHPALLPLWSVAIEEQFYVLGPVIFSALKRKQITFFLGFLVLLLPILRLVLLNNTDIILWRFTPARLDGICVGLLLSIFLSSDVNVLFVARRIKHFTYLMFFLLALLIPFKVIFSDHLWISFGHSLVALAFGCVLLVVQVRSVLGKKIHFLNWGFLRYLGLRCYSIYLFHGLFFIVALIISNNFYVGIIIESVLILFVSHLLWNYIEAPLIEFGRKFSYGKMPD